MKMFRGFAIILLAAMPLSACSLQEVASAASVPPPASAANQTVLDEKVAIGAELAYQAASQLILVVNAFKPLPPEKRELVQMADARAFGALGVVRQAYAAGNAESYADAVDRAQAAIRELLALVT